MPLILRIFLIVGALLTIANFIYRIRKRRLQIDYALYWIIFSVVLLVVAVFPGLVTFSASFLGFESPSNLVFLVVIFLLILRLFYITIKLSQANEQITRVTQRLALIEKRMDDSDE